MVGAEAARAVRAMTDAPAGPRYDASDAAVLRGKKILMAVTYRDRSGTLLERRQLHGTIVDVDAVRGITVRLAGRREGETFLLPPVLECCEEARPGKYTLKGTGEVVADPDLILTLTITDLTTGEPVEGAPAPQEEEPHDS